MIRRSPRRSIATISLEAGQNCRISTSMAMAALRPFSPCLMILMQTLKPWPFFVERTAPRERFGSVTTIACTAVKGCRCRWKSLSIRDRFDTILLYRRASMRMKRTVCKMRTFIRKQPAILFLSVRRRSEHKPIARPKLMPSPFTSRTGLSLEGSHSHLAFATRASR